MHERPNTESHLQLKRAPLGDAITLDTATRDPNLPRKKRSTGLPIVCLDALNAPPRAHAISTIQMISPSWTPPLSQRMTNNNLATPSPFPYSKSPNPSHLLQNQPPLLLRKNIHPLLQRPNQHPQTALTEFFILPLVYPLDREKIPCATYRGYRRIQRSKGPCSTL